MPTELTFDFQSKKEDSDTDVGSQMNLEGGVGADFLKGGLTLAISRSEENKRWTKIWPTWIAMRSSRK